MKLSFIMRKANIFLFLISILYLLNNFIFLNADSNKTIVENTGTMPHIKEVELSTWPSSIYWFDKNYPEPIVFRGIAKNWKVMNLTYEKIAKEFPDSKFLFGIDEEEKSKYAKCFPDSEEEEIDGFFDEKPDGWPLTFSDFWKRVQKGEIKRFYGEVVFNKMHDETDYLPHHLAKYFSEIFKNDAMPEMFKDASKTTLFVSGPGSVRLTHSHESVLLVQIEGRKIMTFASPDQAEQLYVKHCKNGKDYKENDKSCVSPVNIRNPDLEKFPEFKNAHLMQVLIEPGDIIFIPEGWFHEVRALDNSVSLSFFYKT